MSKMIDTARPGIILGDRPEKRVQIAVSALDNQLIACFRSLRGSQLSMVKFQGILNRIECAEKNQSETESLSEVETIKLLRHHLSVDGMTVEHIVETFAAVRIAAKQLLDLYAHPEQLFAGWSMLHGAFVEMNTGEGKTLTAAFPAIVVALTGTPVHVITVNEYLVQRDANKLSGLYSKFGLRTGVVIDSMSEAEKRHAYAADIVYCTNKQVVFDYLRDQQALGSDRSGLKFQIRSLLGSSPVEPMMRGLSFAIVDEADSIMIDDARTPMILAEQRPEDRSAATETAVALGIARTLHEGADFRLQLDSHTAWLTESGMDAVRKIADSLEGAWRFERFRNELVRQALCALHMYRRDRDYILHEGRIKLIDESTGRVLSDRKLQHGLHRMLEVKEKCSISPPNEVIAGTSFQRFFQRYIHLSGMSGTVYEVRNELQQVYGVEVVRIPPQRPVARKKLKTTVFTQRSEQLEYVITDVVNRHVSRQPVLIGTRSVELSERISDLLSAKAIPHKLLNARQDSNEADTVALAGRPEGVTVATNMAGRGTDIILHGIAADLGGLHVINLEVNDSRRVDRQLFGRGARQGDPGSCQSVLTLSDEMVTSVVPASGIHFIKKVMEKWPVCGQWIAAHVIKYVQRHYERMYRKTRIDVFLRNEKLERQLAIGGDLE